MAKKRALGRNLGALLGSVEKVKEAEAKLDSKAVTQLPIEKLSRGKFQPRTQFAEDSLNELAKSIKAQGLVQPIVVRETSKGYEIVAGERRWRAAQIAGLHDVPVVVREIDDITTAAFSIIENIQREDLNPIEEATALERFVEDFSMTHQQIGEMIGRSRASVSNLLRLLDLNSQVKNLLNESKLEMGHARAILSLSEQDQLIISLDIIKKKLSVRETEKRVKQYLAKKDQPEETINNKKDPHIKAIEDRLAEKMCTKIDLLSDNKGKGKLVIHYNSLDELDGILQQIEK